jgi:hypothetical protein
MVDSVAPAAGRMGGDKFSQNLRDGRSVVVGGDLGITSHGVFRQKLPLVAEKVARCLFF